MKTIVISAINIFEGGTLSILKECLSYLNSLNSKEYTIIAYVHDSSILSYPNIKMIELKKSRHNYLYRLYYEYFWFYFQSKKLDIYLWLSLHDITPNVKSQIRAVYCHNASPFYKLGFKELWLDPKFGFFNFFYKWIYKINLNKNDFIIVQQEWLREKFKNELKAKANIIVSNPNIEEKNVVKNSSHSEITKFFYPSLPRVFKNFECVCEAARILNEKKLDFEIILTISGNENRYSRYLFHKYRNIPEIKFIGRISRDNVFRIFSQIGTLLFPSKLETWGLPITEAKLFNKNILVSDLPYAKETVGAYEKVTFFNPDSSEELANLMESTIKGNIEHDGNKMMLPQMPFASNWEEMFNLLLNYKNYDQ